MADHNMMNCLQVGPAYSDGGEEPLPRPQAPPQSHVGEHEPFLLCHPVLQALVMLPETLVPGRSIRIRGFIPQDAERFAINLQHGADNYKDSIALYFDVRFVEGRVVRNHLLQGQHWGHEETAGEIPFQRNEQFEVIFAIEQKGIRVAANGEPFTIFNHRLPLAGIDHIKIHNDVDITMVKFEELY